MSPSRQNPSTEAIDQWVNRCVGGFVDQLYASHRGDDIPRYSKALAGSEIGSDLVTATRVLCVPHLSRPNAGMRVAAQTLVDAILELNAAKAKRVAEWMKAEDLDDYVRYYGEPSSRKQRRFGKPTPSADQARRAAASIAAKIRRAKR
jgi:hypothetical protein